MSTSTRYSFSQSLFNLRFYPDFPKFYPGIPPDIYLKFLDHLRGLREENALEELSPSVVTPNQITFGKVSLPETQRTGFMGFLQRIFAPAPAAYYQLDYDIRGGMKVPHIHLDGKIYLLNDKQWADFSAQVIGDLQERLQTAKSIPMTFDQINAVSETAKVFGLSSQ